MFLEKDHKLFLTINNVIEELGLSIYDLEQSGSKIKLSIFKGNFQKSNQPSEGVSSQDCINCCRKLMEYFLTHGDEYGISLEPDIEVSSPGVNRILRNIDHFTLAKNERVKLYLKNSLNVQGPLRGQTYLIGQVVNVASNEIAILPEQNNSQKIKSSKSDKSSTRKINQSNQVLNKTATKSAISTNSSLQNSSQLNGTADQQTMQDTLKNNIELSQDTSNTTGINKDFINSDETNSSIVKISFNEIRKANVEFDFEKF